MRAEQQTEDRLSEKVAGDRSLFFLLLSLLRPSLRLEAPGEYRRLGLPRQRARIRAWRRGGLICLSLHQRFESVESGPRGVACTFPLPPGAVITAMDLNHGAPRVAARVGGRRPLREEFEQARWGGCRAALLRQDAPGVFTQELSWMERGTAATTRLTACYPVPPDYRGDRGDHLQLTLSFAAEASPPEVGFEAAARRFNLFPGGVAAGERAAEGALLSRQTESGSLAVFRGRLAGRRVRVVLETCAAGPSVIPDIAPAMELTCRRIAELAEMHRSAAKWSAERERLAVRVADIGLEQRLVTPWTSMLAGAGGGIDSDGEAMIAAAV